MKGEIDSLAVAGFVEVATSQGKGVASQSWKRHSGDCALQPAGGVQPCSQRASSSSVGSPEGEWTSEVAGGPPQE